MSPLPLGRKEKAKIEDEGGLKEVDCFSFQCEVIKIYSYEKYIILVQDIQIRSP